ncbi:MAG: hypothetical protein NTU76_02405 [Candidatus Taylorbacteria bacterium]|nr:hypothetical protein [Candidatus Taylorbacteria bacterium]
MYSIVFSGSQAGDSTAILSPDRTYLAFTVPSLAPGNYSISAMFQTSTGEQIAVSNSVPFIIGSTSTPPSITVLSPNGGETWQTGTTQTIKWQDSMTYPTFAPVSYDIKLATYCGGQVCVAIAPYTIVKSVTGSSYSWGVGKTIDFFGTLVPDGAYTIQVCQTGTNTCDSSDSYFKITSAITQPTATVNGSPILKLTYDSQQRESKLTAIFEGTITTGNQTTYIYQNSAYILFTNQTGMTGVNTTIYGSGIITPLSSLDSVTDQWGRILYVLPANQTIKFTITSNSNPKIMFAGSYVASLQNINGTYTINSTDINISVPTNKTNNKTIIGELSPYITSVTQNLKVGDLMTIYGSRLNENGSTDRVYIDGVAITIDGWKGGGTSIGFNLPNLTAGQHNIQISNTYGMSNIIYFTVTGSTQTQPSITSITPSQGSAGTVLTIIGSNLSGATTIEFYSDSGQMMGSFAPSFSSVSSASLTFPIHGLFAANMTPGFYQVGVVTNTCAGGCNSNRIGFTFTAPATTPSITVISPNGGEIIDISKPVTVVLKSTNPYPAKHYINLLDETTAKSYSLDSLLGSSGLIFTDEQISQGRQSVVFNIPSSYNLSPSAKYKIEVCVNNICDKSDNYFSISAPTTVVNGTCGSANGVAVSSAPTANLCSSNIVTISTIGGTGPWTWSCSGINGGTTTSCSAPVIPPVVVSDDKYCKPTGGTWSSGCGSKSAQVAQAGVVLASGETIDLIKITKYVSSLIAKWGAHTVTCPANTNYRVCVENGNDGAGNYILLGVKVAQLNYNYSSPIINSNTQSNLNSVNVATILESVDLNDLINLLKLIK